MSLIHAICILILSFIFGQIIQRVRPKIIKPLRDKAILISLRVATPFSVFASIWFINIKGFALSSVAILGASVILFGFFIGLVIAKIQKLPPLQRGVIAPAGAYINIGGIGGFIVYFLLGEKGFALVAIYKLFEELIYYGLLFPFAAKHSQTIDLPEKRYPDPTVIIMLLALIVGLGLNFTGVNRPEIFETLLKYSIPIAAFCMLFSIGLVFKTKGITTKLKLASLIVICRPIAYLSFTCLFLYVLQFSNFENFTLISQVCLVLAFMPSAFVISLPASIYELDSELANAIWSLSTLLFILLLPLIIIVPEIAIWLF